LSGTWRRRPPWFACACRACSRGPPPDTGSDLAGVALEYRDRPVVDPGLGSRFALGEEAPRRAPEVLKTWMKSTTTVTSTPRVVASVSMRSIWWLLPSTRPPTDAGALGRVARPRRRPWRSRSPRRRSRSRSPIWPWRPSRCLVTVRRHHVGRCALDRVSRRPHPLRPDASVPLFTLGESTVELGGCLGAALAVAGAASRAA